MITPSWVKYGDRRGWLWRGTVPAREMTGATFWVQASRVACVAEGGCLDMVQCYDAAIMTAGPLGANAISGTLPRLLREIPPVTLEAHLGDLFDARHMGLDMTLSTFTKGLRKATTDDLRLVFLDGADIRTWHYDDPAALVAREWVVRLARMLADPCTRRAVGTATAAMLRGYASAEARNAFCLVGTTEPPDPRGRRGYAAWLSFAINNPKGAAALLKMAGADADRLLDVASQPGPWPNTFAQRVGRTRAALDAEAW
jgi:hypothetical protein